MSEPAVPSPAENEAEDAKGSPEPFIRSTRKRKSISYKEDPGDDEDKLPTPKRARAGRPSKRVVRDSDDEQEDGDAHENDDTDDFKDDENVEEAKPKKRAVKRKSSGNRGKESDGETAAPKKRRRSKKMKLASEDDDEEGGEGDENPKPKKRQRKSKPPPSDGDDPNSSPKPKRRGRAKKTSIAPTAEDGEGRTSLDPTLATMADICADPGVGRLSSRFTLVNESFAKDKELRKKRRQDMHARAMKRLYGEHVEGETSGLQPRLSLKTDENGQAGDDDFDYDQVVSVSGHHAVQMRIGDNGAVVLDEVSLQVDRADDPEHRNDEVMEMIEESDLTRFVNSATYTRKVSGQRWTKEETELFYNALQQFGSDFTAIALSLGTRPRNQIKQKFNREDKLNPDRITWALKNRLPIDIAALSRKTGRSFDGPVPEYGPSKEQLEAAEAVARASSVTSSRKATREPSEAPSTASGKGRAKKKGKALPDGLEVLGSIEDYVDNDVED